MPRLTDQVFTQDQKPKDSASIVTTLKNKYTQNKEICQAVAQALVMVGVLRLAADYMQKN